jgi:rod shape-determining protein MreD
MVVGWLSFVVESSILGNIFPMEFKPDLTLLIVVWIGLKRAYIPGVIAVFLLGVVEDLLSGAPLGLFPVIYLTVFMFSVYVSVNFDVDQLGAGLSVALLACSVSFSLIFLARWFIGQISFEPQIIKIVILKTILSSLSLIIFKPVLDGAWKGYSRLMGAT